MGSMQFHAAAILAGISSNTSRASSRFTVEEELRVEPVEAVAGSGGRGDAVRKCPSAEQSFALVRPRRLSSALFTGFVRLLNTDHDPRTRSITFGVVVSGTEAHLDVAVGSDRLATLLAKELCPLDGDVYASSSSSVGSVGVVE